MKRRNLKRNRSKYVNLAELVRNRSRYHPYAYSSRPYTLPLLPRAFTRRTRPSIWNNRIGSQVSVRKRRTRSGQGRQRLPPQLEIDTPATRDRSVNPSPTYSSVHTQYEPYSQSSIPSELCRLLEEASSDSNEDIPNANTRTYNEERTVPDKDVPQTSGTCSQRNNHEEVVNSDDDEFFRVEGTENEEEPENISEPEELEERISSTNNSRSCVLELPEQSADEEAGGDGHHNNSVIEIEITLTPSNDTNSDDEENPIIDVEQID